MAIPNQATSVCRRDHAPLLLAAQTRLRQSELTGLRCRGVLLGASPYARCHGNGRKERCTPLTRQTLKVLPAWLMQRHVTPDDLLVPSRDRCRLSPDACQRLLHNYAIVASRHKPSLGDKTVTPHVLRLT